MAKIPKCRFCGKEFKKVYSSTQKVCSSSCGYKLAKVKREEKELKSKNSLNKVRDQDNKSKRIEDLQKEVNRIARRIDRYFNYGCIDCGKVVEGVGNGAHYHNVRGNENIRFNLHNIHLSRINCNQYSSEHKKDYKTNLPNRYNEEYYELVEYGLGIKYKSMHLTLQDVKEALKNARYINRNFDTFIFKDSISARNILNKMIGIYI